MRFCYLVPLIACGLLVGCGDAPQMADVSGRITFQGEPLVGATVTTQPIATAGNNSGSGSFGKTDQDGRYQLELVKPARSGAMIGEHRVLITPDGDAPQGDSYQETDDAWSDNPLGNQQRSKLRWPASLQDGSLRLTVPPSGRDDADFDL